MLGERIESEQITEVEKMTRNERINNLIGNAITNLRKKRENSSHMQTEPNQNFHTGSGFAAANQTSTPPVIHVYHPL